MDEHAISEVVRKFISDHITSVAQLEILLLLHANPQQVWTAKDIARELRIEVAGAGHQLEALAARGLIRAEKDGFVYAPRTPDLHEATMALVQAYLVKRVTVIGLIFAKPVEPLRAFADAFRLRKEPPRDPSP